MAPLGARRLLSSLRRRLSDEAGFGMIERVFAREESDFDYCTALPDPSGTGATCS
jgi:hypothetical protein